MKKRGIVRKDCTEREGGKEKKKKIKKQKKKQTKKDDRASTKSKKSPHQTKIFEKPPPGTPEHIR